MDVLVEDVSVKYCMQSTLAMGRAAKTSALEQMEQMKKLFQLQFHPRNFKHCHSICCVIQIRVDNNNSTLLNAYIYELITTVIPSWQYETVVTTGLVLHLG